MSRPRGHDSRGHVAPEGRVIYYGNVPNTGRDISNLCRHNCGFYGNRRKNSSFPGSNRFSVYVSRGLTPPRVVPTPFLLHYITLAFTDDVIHQHCPRKASENG